MEPTNRIERYTTLRNRCMNDSSELARLNSTVAKAVDIMLDEGFFGANILPNNLGVGLSHIPPDTHDHILDNLVGRNKSKKVYQWATELALYGDLFLEKVHDNGKLMMVQKLPVWSMFRIETVNMNLIEFQQSATGPDYAALSTPINQDDGFSNAIRFKPSQIVHMRLMPEVYGTSIFESEYIDAEILASEMMYRLHMLCREYVQ